MSAIPIRTIIPPLLTVCLACGAGEREDVVGSSGAPGNGHTGHTGADAGDSDDGGGGDGDDGGAKFDISGGSGGPGDEDMGCHKVDFLFVVDNSGSMEDEQNNLINSFPGFISTISDTLNAQDYHIMVVSTDNNENTGSSTSCSNGVCNCTPAPVCCQNACGPSASSCNGFDCNNLPISECDWEWGTGKRFSDQGQDCGLLDDRRYMIDGQPDVADTFACIARVGTYGSGAEKPMLAMGSAVSVEQNEPGGCDEGFLRDDAILVVTVITDEEDDMTDPDAPGSPGEPDQWAQALVDAKHGNDKAVVVLGLFGDSGVSGGLCPPGADPGAGAPGAEDAPRLRSFVEQFPHHVLGSVCAPDYAPFFEDATQIIDLSCEEFFPPG